MLTKSDPKIARQESQFDDVDSVQSEMLEDVTNPVNMTHHIESTEKIRKEQLDEMKKQVEEDKREIPLKLCVKLFQHPFIFSLDSQMIDKEAIDKDGLSK